MGVFVYFKKEMVFFFLRRLFDGIERATNGKRKIEDARQKGLDPRGHGREGSSLP